MQINVLEYFTQGPLLKCPSKIAVVDHDRRYTFDELNRFARDCAAQILRRTTAFARPIAVFLPKGATTIIADLAILFAGNCYANLDIKSPSERLRRILNNLGDPLIITSARHLPMLKALDVPDRQVLLVEEAMAPAAAIDDAMFSARLGRVIDTDPVYIMHTSGSTGMPKGVIISHRSVIDYIDWAKECYQISGAETIGNQAPFFFDNSTLDLYLCLACGATLVVIPEELFAFPLRLMDYVRQAGITMIFWVPSVMTHVAHLKILDTTTLAPLTKILFAGEVMPTRTVTYWRRKYPHAILSNLYGPTEITVDCTYYTVDRDFADDEKLPIGFPCRNSDVLILSQENRPVEGSEVGELCVRGSSLALGYWNNPERTAAAFVQNPLNPHYPEWIYRTGDLVYRNPRGEIMFVGRKDFQIKHQGYRIELGEIEHAVLQLQGVRNACVVYQPERKEIILYFESEQELPPAAFRERLGTFIPKYMLPTVFHRLEQMPVNSNGKIDRDSLLKRVA